VTHGEYMGMPGKDSLACKENIEDIYKAVSSCTPTFFFLHPHNVMQRQKYPYYFLKFPKYT